MNKKILWNTIIIMAFFLFLIFGIFLTSEILSAKKACESELKGSYQLSIIQGKHFCNEEELFKYHDGWGYEIKNKDIDLSKID